MAPDKNNFSNLLAVSPNFLTQILFAVFLALLLWVLGNPLPISIFLGVLAAVAIGSTATASKKGPKASPVASSEGIDAGLKYWLFFLLGFVLLGYQATTSILLGSLAGIGAGFIIAWWQSKGEYVTQLPEEDLENGEEGQLTSNTKRRSRKTTRRFRRQPGNINFPWFWRR